MLAVFVSFEAAIVAVALLVLDWSLPLVILAAVLIHVLAMFALIAIAATKGRSHGSSRVERGHNRRTQAGGALSPLPPHDA
jgi:uncharacterized integral membrane protein